MLQGMQKHSFQKSFVFDSRNGKTYERTKANKKTASITGSEENTKY